MTDPKQYFYCLVHPDFEGLNLGHLHDHLENNHPEVPPKETEQFIYSDDYRHSDSKWIHQTWGRPPKFSNMVSDSEIDKK